MRSLFKIRKYLFISFILFLFFSCSSDSNDGTTNPVNYNFEILQDVQNIAELDNVSFSIDNENNAAITNITWFIDNIRIDNASFTLEKSFPTFGNYTVTARVDYNNNQSKTVEKVVLVAERPKYTVTIKKVELLSYSNDNFWYVNLLGYYVKLKFDITELDESNTQTIKYISSIDEANWGNGGIMFYPKVWDISDANYQVKVYQTGNFYPNNQPDYHTRITFYAARSQGLVQQPFYGFNNLELNLNPYRSLQPSIITLTNLDVEIRLTLQWN